LEIYCPFPKASKKQLLDIIDDDNWLFEMNLYTIWQWLLLIDMYIVRNSFPSA
jgi:hypothetical protein